MFILLTTAMLLSMSAMAKVDHLLPKPQSVTVTEGSFALDRAVKISDSFECVHLRNVLKEIGCTTSDDAAATVTVTKVNAIDGAHDYELYGYDNEAYTLTITADAIDIEAVTATGVIRAAQTIAQLAEGWDGTAALQQVSIKDWPAFKLRGYMHDVGRSFVSVETLKKHIDLLSRFKVNTFHWHMTENQAWRFQVNAYPKLTQSEYMTRFPGQFYTQAECTEVEAYAAERGVIVIPEIDLPGHSAAFERAMGYGMQTEEGKAALKVILAELTEAFPLAPYIHIGADEQETTEAYLDEMVGYVRETLGRKCAVWNPISNVAVNKIDAELTQMWGTAGKAVSGKANIDCRYNYTNHFDVFADLVGIYKSNIYYEQQGNATVAGTISGCWNDRKLETEDDIVEQNNFYANVIASSCRAWMGGGKQYIDNCTNGGTNGGGGVMLPNSGDEYDDFADWERRFLFHKAHSLKDELIPYVKQTNVRWRISDAFNNGGDVSKVFPPEEQKDADKLPDQFTYEGATYNTGIATGAGIYLRHTWGQSIINAYYKNPAYEQTAYAWTYVYSPKEQTVGALIEFQNYSRSELDAVPAAGQWDLYGSKIWVNGAEIPAPSYENTGVSLSSKEVTQKNENFPAREPVSISLKKGWNKVFLKLPYINAAYRLDKWMFTFVLTDADGKNAVDGLIYSPNQCMDGAAEQVAAKISELKRERSIYIGTEPGMWPESLAEDLDAIIAEVEATLSESMDATARDAQLEELESVLSTFKALPTANNMIQPLEGAYYRMCTPLRENRYPTSSGANTEIVGNTTADSKASVWSFVKRGDSTFDIVNLADGTYISPASNYNTALKSVAEQPNAGWTIKPAKTPGYVIITSGSAQFNQTNNSTLGYKVYNWGGGSNIDDTGCQYKLIDVTEITSPEAFATYTDIADATYPYEIDATTASRIFAAKNLTIAFDVQTSATTDNNELLIAACDPTAACEETDVATTNFTGVGFQGGQVRFYISAKSDQWHTRGDGVTASTNHKVVIVFSENAESQCYMNGAKETSGLKQNFYHHASNSNAKIFIGGGKTSAGVKYPFDGTIRSVQFFEGAFDADKIGAIEYPETDNSIAEAVTSNANINIYGLQRHFGLVQDAGTGLDGNGQFVCNYPASTSQESGNAYANMIDNNFDTFFHSGYNGTRGDGAAHYLQVNLTQAVNNFRFYFKKRGQNNNNNRPTEIEIQGSNEANGNYTTIATINSGMPTDETVHDYYSDEIKTDGTKYKYLRFVVKHTNGDTSSSNPFFTFSEFYLLKNSTKVAETFNAVRNYRYAAKVTTEIARTLNTVYLWNKGLTEGSPIDGCDHYLYSDTYYNGAFVNRYMYNNNGTLSLNTSCERNSDAYVWTAAKTSNGYYTFVNKAGKYLGHKAMSDAAYNFTVAASTRHAGVTLYSVGASRYLVTKNDGTTFDQSTITYDQTSGDWNTDYVFIPTDLYSGNYLNVECNNSAVGATFTWNNVDFTSSVYIDKNDEVASGTLSLKNCDASYIFEGFYADAAYTQSLGKTVEINELTADKTIYAKFALNIFASAFGEKGKMLRLKAQRKANYVMGAYTESGAANQKTVDYRNLSQLWYLVGNADGFKIYNKAIGDGKALNIANASDATPATMVAAESATVWKLIDKNGSYAIVPSSGTNLSLNAYGGLGYDIKLYDAGDAGGWWVPEIANDDALVINYEMPAPEDIIYAVNTRIGTLDINVEGVKFSKVFTTSSVFDAASAKYLPVGATYSIGASLYRGYKFAIENDGQEVSQIENATVAEGGSTLRVKFLVDTDNKYQYLYYSNDANGKPYRIPAIATAMNGDIIAISDNRPCGMDIGYGEVDIKCRISTDNGATWGEEFFIADGKGGSTNEMTTGNGDAAVVADRESNRVLVMMVCGHTVCWNGRWDKSKIGDKSASNVNRVARVYGTYDEEAGKWNWTAPEEVTDHIYSLFLDGETPTVTSMFIGSGRIMQSRVVKKGDYYRLYCSMWTRDNGNRVIYSDDFGGTWNVLGAVSDRPAPSGDEPKCEELPDGTVVLSSRKSYGRYFNLFTFDNDDYTTGTWGSVVSSDGVGGLTYGNNTTNGEIFKVKAVRKSDNAICDLMLQSVPCGDGRRDVGIFYKELTSDTYTTTLFAQGWTKGLAVTDKESAYSTMTLQADGKIGFFYEEVPNGYCMVYIPLSIEEITNGAYKLYSVEASVSSHGIATFYSNEAMRLPDGVQAYVALENPDYTTGTMYVTEVEDVIPAKTGVVLVADEGKYDFHYTYTKKSVDGENRFVGYEGAYAVSDAKQPVSLEAGSKYYVLAVENGTAAFYKKTSDFNVFNNRAYLKVPEAEGAAHGLKIIFDRNTAIENVNATVSDKSIYDLSGRRLENVTESGIYIVGGNKMFIKK